ncbi:MAG: molybdenum cofactor guanylyltransferase [Oscillospiraceae bacterium]|jgi:molybdopterin-guanine dinucleotide biosynthesis protein A|nr:molybdenum cofactor guanylyltransferase [Oscillospiraceae bacterium]
MELHTVPVVVLAGGKSSRMGRDKMALPLGGETMLGRTVRVFGEAFGRVYVSGAGEAVPGAERIPDIISGGGPASGLHAAMKTLPDAAFFLVAGDMPLSDPRFAVEIIARAAGFDAAAAGTAERPEPLFAYYTRAAESAVDAAADGTFGLARVLKSVNTVYVEVPEEVLTNVNTPSDYDKIFRKQTHNE